MNKERLEEIIDHIHSYPNTPYYPNICNELIQAIINLQDKINQLETNKYELKKWLKEEIDRISKMAYKTKPKPYGEELHLHENAISRYRQVLSKIEELERGKEC